MKRAFLLFPGIVFFSITSFGKINLVPVKTSLTGIITDKQTGDPLSGVTVYITDLKTGAVSRPDGTYKIENLPQSMVLVQVSLIGYKLISEKIDLSIITTKDFALDPSVAELNEVVVTGLSGATEKSSTPTSIEVIPPKQLQQIPSTNIIDAIATQPGVSQVTTGAGISKPVIRGLGYNRVVVVNDGIRQEGQQWGDEHGIEIDEYAVSKVEILKGPASIAYGPDAMAGVINMISAPTLQEGTIGGNLLGNYQTNNGLIAGSANFAGNKKGFIWDIRYSDKLAHAYQNKYDGYVFNSGFKENNVGGIIGLNKAWGYSHLHFSIYNFTPGIIEGARDSATGKFVKAVALNDSTEGSVIASGEDFKSYDPFVPFQKVHHYKAVLNNSFVIGNGSLKIILGWQQNQRQEFPDVLNPDQYGLFFFLNTVNYDVRYLLPEKNNWDVSFGVSGMQQTNQNKGIEFLIPAYSLFDIGGFLYTKKDFGKFDVSGGIRYDIRSVNSKQLVLDSLGVPTSDADPDGEILFGKFTHRFSSVSGTIGGTYSLSNSMTLKLNFSRGFRSPNMTELSANGVHEGTFRYIRGDVNLDPETSSQIDLGLAANTTHVSFELSLFSNSIQNYIFLHKIASVNGGDSLVVNEEGTFSVFQFFQGRANLSGGEVMIDIHPHPFDWLHFENSFSYVQATQRNQPDSTKYLPFTPPPKLTSELRANARKVGKNLSNAYIKFGVDHYFQQDKFYAAFGTETATPGFTLLNLGAGTEVTSKGKNLFSLYISVNNLTDVSYQSHLSRLKYGDVNNVTGRAGVFDMGRNISFKLLVPIDFTKKKSG